MRTKCALGNKVYLCFIAICLIVSVSCEPLESNATSEILEKGDNDCLQPGCEESLAARTRSMTLKRKRSHLARIITFNVQNLGKSSRTLKFTEIQKVLGTGYLAAVQEIRSKDAAIKLLKLLGEDKYGLVASNLLGNKHKELNAIYYRKDILNHLNTHHAKPLNLSSGKVQLRPPSGFEFQLKDSSARFTVITCHTTPDASRNHCTREEINYLKTFKDQITAFPGCSSKNVIIMGDYNQSPRYVLKDFKSMLDSDTDAIQLTYDGRSSVKGESQLDRIHLYGALRFAISSPNATVWNTYTDDPKELRKQHDYMYSDLIQQNMGV